MLLARRPTTRTNNDKVITNLVGKKLEGGYKWKGTLAAPNGSLYGIPLSSRRVVKFNPLDKSITEIGPDFGNNDGWKWDRGAITDSGIIYCVPYRDRGILKIDTNTDAVTVLDVNLLPERGEYLWRSCALALDGCIYFVPHNARRIMKLDPNNGDVMSSVGDDLGDGNGKYSGTVVGIDGCVYGIPCFSKRIVKYDPINDSTLFVGEEADRSFSCCGNGAVGRDGFIYARAAGQVLKIDTVNNSHSYVAIKITSRVKFGAWGDAVLGIDGCIYWAPYHHNYTLKYDPRSNKASLVGDNYEHMDINRWVSGALAADGIIYCIPTHATKILAIDPIGEFLETNKANMQDHPDQFGCLFQTIEADEEDSDEEDSVPSFTNFDLAVDKFGQKIVFEVLETSMKPVIEYCRESNLYPFMIAASYKESPVCVINHYLRCDLSWVTSTIINLEGSAPKHKKIRIE